MSNEKRRILDLLAAGKINADEAERLLSAVRHGEESSPSGGAVALAVPVAVKAKPKYLCVRIDDTGRKGRERVNMRIPLGLVRAGMKLRGLMPADAQAKVETALVRKGFEAKLSDLGPEELEAFIESLCELAIEIDDVDGAKVQIFCE